jgi:tetratricopeptide (TPR) repeat protein
MDVGTVCFERGAAGLALAYFERAITLRRSGYALTKRGKCLRDLGRLDEAALTYRQAMECGGRSFGFARLGLVAVLCDLREYSEASVLAEAAAEEEPDNPAVASVVLRCLEECRGALEQSVDPRYIDQARIEARDLRAHTQTIDPVPAAERLRQRRERVLPQYVIGFSDTGGGAGEPAPLDPLVAEVWSDQPAGTVDEPGPLPARTVREGLFRRIARALRRTR